MYFKITNEKENHRGLQYRDGLVKDINDFNNDPKYSCCKGGIYFSDEKNILKFAGYGVWIRQVDIPEDAQWLKDRDGDKWRADKLFFHPRKDLFTVETIQWLMDIGFDVNEHSPEFFSYCCDSNRLNVVEFLAPKIKHINVDHGFTYNSPLREAAKRGYLDIVKCLIKNGANVNLNNSEALMWASNAGHIEVVKYLVENGANINNEYGLRWAAEEGHLEVVKFLSENGADVEDVYAYLEVRYGGLLVYPFAKYGVRDYMKNFLLNKK